VTRVHGRGRASARSRHHPHGSAPMRCTSLAVLLGVPLLLASPGIASAQPASLWTWGCNNGSSFGASLTARLNQHGPLFNYGPYYGYPPFEPYGPWNAYLQYNPWYYGVPSSGCAGCAHGDLSGHGPLCPGWSLNWHSSWSLGGWYHGCSTCSHGGLFTSHSAWGRGYFSPSCKTCGITGSVSEIAAPTKVGFNPETTDPLARCSGVGNAKDFAGFYSGLPTLDLTAVPAGGVAK